MKRLILHIGTHKTGTTSLQAFFLANAETLLVIGDRTADSIVPLFVSSFENIVFVHPSKTPVTVEKLVKKYNVTKVLYLYGANEYMTDRTLLRTLQQ